MEDDIILEVDNVSKKFSKTLRHTIQYGIVDIGRSIFNFEIDSHKLRPYEFWALKNISFKLKRGEVLGIIGTNGSGKSTLLKLLNGIFMPDKGSIFVKGKVGALISVGAGFHPMLTGRENIYINGVILGMTRREIDKKFDTIVNFADIGDFLDTPVKNYSSGMYVKLGFSVAIHSDPDILLVDEILSVCDADFQGGALRKMKVITKNGGAIIFVSHNISLISSFTKKAIYLKNGIIKKINETPIVIKKYLEDDKKD